MHLHKVNPAFEGEALQSSAIPCCLRFDLTTEHVKHADHGILSEPYRYETAQFRLWLLLPFLMHRRCSLLHPDKVFSRRHHHISIIGRLNIIGSGSSIDPECPVTRT